MKRIKGKSTKWRAYSDLAWTEPIIAPPEDYAEETEAYVKAIKEHSKIEAKTLLHLGCGAGINDYTFKRHFKVTGVDISENMIENARNLNPEIVYLRGDMRTIKLGESFDAVAIPDSIGYMTTLKDLRKAVITTYKHLKPDGVLLIMANIKEQFKQNSFVYTGSKGNVEITLFENNYISARTETTYEATLIFLIRREGKLEIHTDRHIIGIFNLKTWLDLLKEVGFEVKHMKMEHLYDRFVMGEGEYPLTMFICIKSL
jgi:SAM-dependent methyltransferase